LSLWQVLSSFVYNFLNYFWSIRFYRCLWIVILCGYPLQLYRTSFSTKTRYFFGQSTADRYSTHKSLVWGDIINLYINLACFSWWVSVSLYPINVKTAEPIGPKFFVGSRVTPGKVYERWKLKKIVLKSFIIL